MNVDEQLRNADWPKRTCDWPLPELDLCDSTPYALEEQAEEQTEEPDFPDVPPEW